MLDWLVTSLESFDELCSLNGNYECGESAFFIIDKDIDKVAGLKFETNYLKCQS
jgi:hypothetical protein